MMLLKVSGLTCSSVADLEALGYSVIGCTVAAWAHKPSEDAGNFQLRLRKVLKCSGIRCYLKLKCLPKTTGRLLFEVTVQLVVLTQLQLALYLYSTAF